MPSGRRRTVEQVEKDQRAVRLRRQNLSYEQIAKEIGLQSPQGAYAAVRRGLADSISETNDEVRQQECDRLDELMRRATWVMTTRHWLFVGNRIARHPDTNEPLVDSAPTLRAIETILKIMKRRAELLGLDATPKIEVITTSMIDAEIHRLSTELAMRAPEE